MKTVWLLIVITYVALCFVEYAAYYGNSRGLWYHLSKSSQWLALGFGRLGLYAESKYHEATL